jgi:flagellar biogenesis protein FliO
VSLKAAADPGKSELDVLTTDDVHGVLNTVAWVTGSMGVAAIVSLWLLRVWLTRGNSTQSPRSLNVLDSLRINPRCGLYLVQADNHRILVGVDQGKAMSLLALPGSFADSLQDADAPDMDEPAVGPVRGAANSFDRVADVFSELNRRVRPGGRT